VAEKVGEILVLGLGTAWFGLSYVAMLLAAGYPLALLIAFSAGAGGGAYHPVGTALIANVFPPARAGSAIGTLNFFGDVGKVVFPAAMGMLVVAVGWRWSFAVQGALGVVMSLCYLIFFRHQIVARLRHIPRAKQDSNTQSRARRRSLRDHLAGWGIRKPRQFALYTTIGFVDVAVRTAATAFLGFILIDNGVEDAALGWLMSLTFLGGAAGKLLCGMVVDRWSSRFTILVTEVLMILGCFALPSVPVGWPMLFFLPLFGFVLNGTSSVIYIGLAPTFTREQRSRGYALYYTTNFFSVALAPFAFGLVGDSFGLDSIFFGAGLIMAISMPLVLFVRDEAHRTT
jgi:MFS family permease|tara:strand:+ start:2066 stop:3094 length:1029 start_codon:yes stop_codon:yes gene_type:complete